MKKFLLHIIVYLIIVLLIILAILIFSSSFVKNKKFKNFETESNLLVMKEKEEFDLLFMGISHARNFSRHKNHIRVEKILNKKIINIGQGNGICGINEQLFYLDYFYHKKNKASTVIYFISPPLFFSETLPKSSNTFDYEPFGFSFLFRYFLFSSENKKERLISYLQTKFAKNWYFHKPYSLNYKKEELTKIDFKVVSEGQKMVFKNIIIAEKRFLKSILRVEETIDLALKNKSKVILIIPPALFGKWNGHNKVKNFAIKMKHNYDVEFYDFSETVLSPKYYYDHHHLNTNGIVFFTTKYLKPIFRE